jgi:hypothetical protein
MNARDAAKSEPSLPIGRGFQLAAHFPVRTKTRLKRQHRAGKCAQVVEHGPFVIVVGAQEAKKATRTIIYPST